MRLAVELYGVRAGVLEGDARTFDFLPATEGMETFGVNSAVLSVSIPLTPKQRRDRAARRRNWFGELLPEGDQYGHMLALAGLRRGDTLGFLSRFGRDVAGALQIWDLDDPTEPRVPQLRPLVESEVRGLLEDPMGSPLANDPVMGKSSLGGVQPKVVLVRTGEGWAQPLSGYPSTHILKPQLAGAHETVIFDEEYGARIARRMGLASFVTEIHEFDGLPALVIERYDRIDGERLHQEDLSQVLGASGNEKYQEFGGLVSLGRVADALRGYASEADLGALARMVVLAVAIGNLDMHTKNISLLHTRDGDVRLAPAYDVVPQAHGNNDGKMALAVNKKYLHGEITRADLEAEFRGWRLRGAAELIDQVLVDVRQVVEEEAPLSVAHPGLQGEILGFVDNLQAGRPARKGVV